MIGHILHQFCCATPCHLRGTVVARPAIAVARAWHGRLKAHKNRSLAVSSSLTGYNRPLGLINKGFALVCSLLRGVWTLYEVRRTELALGSLFFRGKLYQKPANKVAHSASKPAFRWQRSTLVATAFLTALLGSPGHPEEWGRPSSFDAYEAKTMRAKAARSKQNKPGEWSRLGAGNGWVALDKFEQSKPGSRPMRETAFQLPSGSQIDQLFALISFAESPRKGYDAIHMSAAHLPAVTPSNLTLGEIKAWITDTPGQHHAIGRYQIIPSTLLNLQTRLGLSDASRFSRRTQDRMASLLLLDAGYQDFMSGKVSTADFMDNLARIWAGLPLQNGKSAYHGYAGNHATISRAFF